jgi:hypothetical protein
MGAGVAGGIAGAWVMNRTHRLFDIAKHEAGLHHAGDHLSAFHSAGPRKEAGSEEPATSKAAAVLGAVLLDRRLTSHQRKAGGLLLHYAFSATAGAFYSALTGQRARFSAWRGIVAGAAIWALADEILVPVSGLARPPRRYPLSKHLQALVNHLFFGLTVEAVRALVSGHHARASR